MQLSAITALSRKYQQNGVTVIWRNEFAINLASLNAINQTEISEIG